MKHKKGLILSLLFFGTLGLSGVVGECNSRNEPNSYELYKQVCTKADANKDGHLTESEWIAAYDIMGIKYNARNPAPYPLTIEQMQTYLASK